MKRLIGIDLVLWIFFMMLTNAVFAESGLADLRLRLTDALTREDEANCLEIGKKIILALGEKAGEPEQPDEWVSVPDAVKPIGDSERPKAFDTAFRSIQKIKWWKIGLDPTTTPHALREPANAALGCAAASRAGVKNKAALLAEAREAADFLLWAQAQAGTGIFPFPACRTGKSREFLVAESIFKKAEATGKFSELVKNGWVVGDLTGHDGGGQYDNAQCGVALLEVYAATGEEKYLSSARSAADWALGQPCVPNVNYNSFTIYFLSEFARRTGEKRYLDNAKKRTRLAVYPTQLTEGPRAGRWADGHNARAVYHYIIARGLVALVGAMTPDDPDRPRALASLESAFKARNQDFLKQGAPNLNSALESLVLAKTLIPNYKRELADALMDEAFSALERIAVNAVRSGKDAVTPGEWGLYLESRFASRPEKTPGL